LGPLKDSRVSLPSQQFHLAKMKFTYQRLFLFSIEAIEATSFFKCLHSIAPKYLRDICTKNTINATRSIRNTTTDLRLPSKSSANRQKCLQFRGAKSWNGLSPEAKQTTSIKAFKCLI